MGDEIAGGFGEGGSEGRSTGGRETHAIDKVGTESKTSRPRGLTVCRSLEDIAQRSQTLVAKGKTARLLDKTQDAQEVGKLVEQLRQAILIYQVRRGPS